MSDAGTPACNRVIQDFLIAKASTPQPKTQQKNFRTNLCGVPVSAV
jgi:hypothetical protein